MIKRICAVALAALAFSGAQACLNDRDTLFIESMEKGNHDALRIVVGWFPVHPPLYYRLRIAHILPAIKSGTAKFALYDDCAVAYERLGDDVDAIRIIELKRSKMVAQKLPIGEFGEEPVNEHDQEIAIDSSDNPWYRYYANCGTFWAHRWFHAGSPPSLKAAWLGRAEVYIAKGVGINPYAHGLREYAQLEMIRWILHGKPGQTFYDFEGSKLDTDRDVTNALAGLVELGGAWESPDVYETLAQVYAIRHEDDLGYIVFQRVLELQQEGKRSLTGRLFTSFPGHPRYPSEDEADYRNLRSAAEDYRKELTGFEMPKLQMGKHPDWTAGFWKGYDEPDFPTYGMKPLRERFWIDYLPFFFIVPVGICVLLAVFIFFKWLFSLQVRRSPS